MVRRHHLATDHWTHGPRWTTHGSSGKRPWWWRSSRRSILPPAGCRDRVSWQPQSWKRGGGGTEWRSRKRVMSLGLSGREAYIGEGGRLGGHQGVKAASRCGPTLGRAPW